MCVWSAQKEFVWVRNQFRWVNSLRCEVYFGRRIPVDSNAGESHPQGIAPQPSTRLAHNIRRSWTRGARGDPTICDEHAVSDA